MNYNEFRKKLIEKDISGTYLLCGEEKLLIDKTINFIFEKFLPESFRDLNFSKFNGSNLNINDFFSSIETIPLMSEYRLIVVDELQALLQKIETDEAFFKTLDGVGKDTILIFIDSDSDLKKTTKLYKYFNKNERIVEFSKLENKDLMNFLKREFKSKKKEISDSDLSYLIMISGYTNKKVEVSLYELMNDVKKLLAYSTSNTVNREEINKTITKAIDSNIFNLLDSLLNKNVEISLEIFYDLYDKSEPIQGILHMIQRRYRHIYQYASLFKDRVGERDIEDIIGISSYEFKTISRYGRSIDLCDLKDSLVYIYESDKTLKSSGREELLIMEHLIVRLCSV